LDVPGWAEAQIEEITGGEISEKLPGLKMAKKLANRGEANSLPQQSKS
jgi:hypothetical protein